MKKVIAFYKVLRCIESSKTLEQLDCCSILINQLRMFGTDYLADRVLIKRVDILSQQYSEVE